jgi:OFA family oxalate/formate antiporter-like MFS transporter
VSPEQAPAVKNRGWVVTFAGLGINLALGILYTWSVIKGGLPGEWTQFEKNLPYSIACLVFCIVMIAAGRMQDRIGPRIVATLGGVLVGIGMILCGMWSSLTGYVVGFGVLAGAGIAFGYGSATPPAVKWFPKAKTGLIAGLVVSGFGAASVYASPLTDWLITSYGLSTAIFALGIAFLVVVVGLSQLLVAPPAGFVPAGTPAAPAATGGPVAKVDFTPSEVLKTWQFYLLWFLYACGSGAGLMIISSLASIAKFQVAIQAGFVLVAALGVGNGAGRIVAGMLSDKLGRRLTMLIFFILQAVCIFLLALTRQDTILANIWVLGLLSAFIGANYGANLSLFPSITKDYYGLKNFGVNYGLVFTAWGIGGFVLSQVMGKVYDVTKSFNYAYFTASALLILAAALTFVIRPPHHEVKAA